jgi:cell division septum initiation protein DivIVA
MLQANCDELKDNYEATKRDKKELEDEIVQLRQQLAEAVAENEAVKAATAGEFPDAADLLSQLRSKRKKSKSDLGDVETLLEILDFNP